MLIVTRIFESLSENCSWFKVACLRCCSVLVQVQSEELGSNFSQLFSHNFPTQFHDAVTDLPVCCAFPFFISCKYPEPNNSRWCAFRCLFKSVVFFPPLNSNTFMMCNEEEKKSPNETDAWKQWEYVLADGCKQPIMTQTAVLSPLHASHHHFCRQYYCRSRARASRNTRTRRLI